MGFGSPWHWLVIGIVALLLFGNRLPEVARSLGRAFSEFKKGLKDVGDSMKDESSDDRPRSRLDAPRSTYDAPERQMDEPRKSTPPPAEPDTTREHADQHQQH